MKSLTKIFFLLCCFQCINATTLPKVYFEHFSTEDGLPQFTITDIMQDHKGFMWFATWNGFSKFDGKTFRNFKVGGTDIYPMETNRIRHLHEDKYGYIWIHSYDDKAHRFDPYTETFEGPNLHQNDNKTTFKLSRIKPFPSGKVWLLSQTDGCICVTDSLLSVQEYNINNNRLKGSLVYDVVEDKQHNSWILTNNGLNLIVSGQSEPTAFFFDNQQNEENQHFFAAVTLENEIWFSSHKGRIWQYSYISGKFKLLQVPTNSDLSTFQQISNDEILITTSNDGFFIYDVQKGTFHHYNTTTNNTMRGNRIRALFFDSYNQFWFETEGIGIYKFDVHTKKIKYYVIEIDDPAIAALPPASDILEDIYHRIWVHPRGGGFSFYDRETDKLIPFYNEELSPEWKFSNILHSLFSDKQGNLWFCTRSHGLEKITFNGNNFHSIKINPNVRSLIVNDVRAVLQDNDQKIWVATKDGCINIYDEHYNHIGSFSETGEIGKNKRFSSIVYSMLQDDNENIWLGTRTDGLFKIRKVNHANQYHIEHFSNNANDIYSISNNAVYSIYQDSQKNIWIGTFGGGLNLVRQAQNGRTIFIHHKNTLSNYPIETAYKVRYISENKFGNIGIGTTTGLVMFSSNFVSPEDIQYRYYSRIPGNEASLSNNDIFSIINTSKGDMFLATFGGGVNKVMANDAEGFPLKFKSFTTKDGLPGDVCLSIQEDYNNNLWISTENNLSRFDPNSESFETFGEIKWLMSTHSFSEASSIKLKNDDLIFGFSGGLLHFTPQNITVRDFKSYIALTDFRVNNQYVSIGKSGSPLEKNIDDVNKLILSKTQNSFSLQYTVLDFIWEKNTSYAYKLEGFDDDWIYSRQNRTANYTKIPKGDYMFRVKSINNENNQVTNERILPITVLPSFWETPWAILIYILLIIGAVYLVIRIVFTFYRLRKNAEVEKYLSEMKLSFFTDISHEIRTPLTMISAPVEYLLLDEEIPVRMKNHLNSISKNTNRMLRLVNQILDFRKIQQSKLKVEEVNAGEIIKNICSNFKELAQKNQIQFRFINQAENEKIWVVSDFFEIVLMNLLSNAFKFTPDGKAISVSLTDNPKHLTIEVKDEGYGISKERQKNLFVRFVSFNEDKSKPSSGIGLSIVKDLVEKHSGKISFESEPGKGSTFTINILKGTKHFGKDVEFVKIERNADFRNKEEIIENGSEKETKKPIILVVEDDEELRLFIKAILEHDYSVVEADNGLEGWKKAQKMIPDFIVSDIMMPQIDGIELLQKLKNDINTSHIPVILLTAKTAIENKLEGLTYGADDYITKPFSVQYFRARIDNLLEQRKRIQEAFRSQFMKSEKPEFELPPLLISSHDENFINRVIEILDEHIDDGEFTIDDICEIIGMSRSVFSNKLKSLTGIPPFDFIRDLKMKRAAQLLASGQLMVKEVSIMIGISDVKYFRKIFKEKHGLTPQEYKDQHNKKVQ